MENIWVLWGKYKGFQSSLSPAAWLHSETEAARLSSEMETAPFSGLSEGRREKQAYVQLSLTKERKSMSIHATRPRVRSTLVSKYLFGFCSVLSNKSMGCWD